MKSTARRALSHILYRCCCRSTSPAINHPLESTRVVVIRFDEIGDLILTLPFLRELRRSMPNARIALVVRPALVNLVELCPHIDSVIPFAPKFGFRPGRLKALFSLRRQVAVALGGEPQLGILPRFDADFSRGLLALLATGAQRRIGFSESATPEKAHADADTDQFLTHPIKPVCADMHELKRNLSLLTALGATAGSDHLQLYISQQDKTKADALLASRPNGTRWIGLCAGASTERKRWPVERYATVARFILDHYPNTAVVVVGGPGDREAGEQIVRELQGRGLNVAGDLALRETAAVLAKCGLYLGNDTGPMHIAAAVGVPIVAIYADPPLPELASSAGNTAARFDPWGVAYRTVTPSDGAANIADTSASGASPIAAVTVEQVIQAVEEVVAIFPGKSRNLLMDA